MRGVRKWNKHSDGPRKPADSLNSVFSKLWKHVLSFENVLKSTPVNESRSPQSQLHALVLF